MARIGPFGYNLGLNTRARMLTLPNGGLSQATNVHLEFNAIRKRFGGVRLNSSAIASSAALHGLYNTYIGTQNYIIATAGTAVFKMEDLDGTFDTITGTITVTTGQNNVHTFAQLNDILAFGNGTDVVHKWVGSGNAADLAGSPPTGGILKTVNSYMFISGISSDPSQVRWSNPNDPETWASTSFVRFRRTDGDSIQALAGIGDDLYIFKRRSIGRLVTQNISLDSLALGPLVTASTGVGCAGKLAIDNLDDNTVAFLAPNAHVYIFDGEEIEDIGDQEPPNSSIQPSLDSLNKSRLQYAVLRYYPSRRWILLSASDTTSATNNVIFVYDLNYSAWFRWEGIAANVMASAIDTRATPIRTDVFFTGSYNGFVTEQDRGEVNPEDGSNKIDGYFALSIPFGIESQDFVPRSLLISVKNSGGWNAEVNYSFDTYNEFSKNETISMGASGSALGSFILGVSQLGSTGDLYKSLLLKSPGRARSIALQFRNRNASEPFQINPITVLDEVVT